jgi:hypothetical protein
MIYVPRSLEILYSSTGNGSLRRLWSALARHSLPRSGLLVNVATFYINNFEFGVESVPVVCFSVF